MKFTLAVTTLSLTWFAASAHLRSSSQRDHLQQASNCNDARDEGSCFQIVDDDTNEHCQWCEAGAIPSECMSSQQASLLPAGVFDCKSPSTTTTVNDMPIFMFQTASKQNDKDENSIITAQLRVNSSLNNKSDLCDPNVESISGYMDIKGSHYDENGESKHLFFWMFEKRDSKDDNDVKGDDSEIPFIVWLTGGPGCSSTLALLSENGPCSVNDDGASTTINPYSWNEAAHVLWLDQPAGVGFSWGEETDNNEEMVAEDAYYFLQAFFQTYKQYSELPLYIVGESYGGHYAPAIAHRVFKGNQETDQKPDTIKLNLSGLGIGNGLTNPEEQYQWYAEMGHNNSHSIQIFDDSTYDAMTSAIPTCTSMIHKCNEGDSIIDNFACQSAFIYCNTAMTTPYRFTGLNPYDITKQCGANPLCYDFSAMEKFLNNKDVKKALNVDPKHSHAWETCNFGINMKFHTDWMKDFSTYVADLLNNGIPALIYAGDLDFICNYLGNKAWTYKLDWNGREDFQGADFHDWQGYGLARSAQGLTFLQVYDAGHMVPADQPKVALEMIRSFMKGEQF